MRVGSVGLATQPKQVIQRSPNLPTPAFIDYARQHRVLDLLMNTTVSFFCVFFMCLLPLLSHVGYCPAPFDATFTWKTESVSGYVRNASCGGIFAFLSGFNMILWWQNSVSEFFAMIQRSDRSIPVLPIVLLYVSRFALIVGWLLFLANPLPSNTEAHYAGVVTTVLAVSTLSTIGLISQYNIVYTLRLCSISRRYSRMLVTLMLLGLCFGLILLVVLITKPTIPYLFYVVEVLSFSTMSLLPIAIIWQHHILITQ